MKNRDVFEKNLETFSLENQGVAKVDEALDPQQQRTPRFELETFVCKGHYEECLKRVLENYVLRKVAITTPDRPSPAQPPACGRGA